MRRHLPERLRQELSLRQGSRFERVRRRESGDCERCNALVQRFPSNVPESCRNAYHFGPCSFTPRRSQFVAMRIKILPSSADEPQLQFAATYVINDVVAFD